VFIDIFGTLASVATMAVYEHQFVVLV